MKNETLYRTSAVVFADSNIESRKTETIRRKFIEAVFVEKGNVQMTIQEIGVAVNDTLDIDLLDNEIEALVCDDHFFVEELFGNKTNNKYRLKEDRFARLRDKSLDNIEVVVNRYLSEIGDNDKTSDSIRNLLNKYLFTLMNTNILAFRQVLNPSSVKRSGIDVSFGKVDYCDFTKDEIDSINRFLSWQDSAKDKELFKLISCCIEYSIAVNNSKENSLVESLKNKTFYLDNALVYRAIGINGETLKKRTLSFIRKCRESGQHLCISKFSYEEFKNTVDFHLNQLNRTTPFGKINPRIFQRYANGEGFYQFYHTWRGSRTTYSFDIFRSYLLTEYYNLLKMYDIKEDYKVPFSEVDDIPAITKYAEEIKTVKKGRGHDDMHIGDARNMYWIECKRDGNDGRMTDTKFYFVTSDQKLQRWDYAHSHNQPITLLPSQWMALLLKYYSRTNDDYKSFVSFLNIPHDEPGINPDELQDILAGISQTTEDFKNQDIIVETFLETDWDKMHQQGKIRQRAQEYAKDKLEEQFAQKILELEKEHERKLSSVQADDNAQIEGIKAAFRQQYKELEAQAKRDKLSNISQQLQDIKQQKNNIEIQLDRYMSRIKTIFIIIGIIVFAFWIYLMVYLGVESFGLISGIIGAIGVAVPTLYCILYEHAFSLEKTISNIRDKKEKEYKNRYSFSDSRLNELQNMYDQLSLEVKE